MAERPVSAISGDTPYAVANIPLPSTSDDDIREPRAPYMASSSVPLTSEESPRESYLNATPNDSGTLLANKHEGYVEDLILPTTTTTTTTPKSKRRSVVLVVLLLVALALIIIAVIVPVYFVVIKPKLNESKNKSNSGGGSGGGPGPSSGGPGGSSPSPVLSNVTTGGDGSTIHAADGTTFIYHNPFGGFCKCFTDFFCPTEIVEARVWSMLVNCVTITYHILSRG